MQFPPLPDRPCRILLIDDDQVIHRLVGAMVRSQDVDLISAMDGAQGLEVARTENPDLILLDYDMPGANGLEVFAQLLADDVLKSIPVVFVTGNSSNQILTACFQTGATDYLRKPFCAPELRARVRAILDRRKLLGQLERLALYDALTGLANRTLIRGRIQSAIQRGPSGNFAVLFLDVDRFKLVNDSLGHDVGDRLLQQIADRLVATLRRGNGGFHNPNRTTVARLGGDEFVVLVEDLADPQDALRVADQLLTTLSDNYCLPGIQMCCTASIGVVNSVRPYATPDEVLRDADTAMYEAKAAGKGRYVLFDQTMHSTAEQRLRIEFELRGAIANDEFFLVYQPIVSLETSRVTGFEALIRWKQPQRGLIMPADFLPIAEETGLIVPIGMWALDEACREFASWRRSLGAAAPSNIHVNLSRKQLLVPDLVATVRNVLAKHAMLPECLHLEVTESEIMQNPRLAKATLTELRQLGVRIDMDDFGTGHSSLACLQELPVDVLKIDRSFTANMERSRSFAALVHAVTTLGQNLGLTVVAEGIETADQLAMLQSMDCEFGQGYFFAKPMPADKVAAYLRSAGEPAQGMLAPYVVPLLTAGS